MHILGLPTDIFNVYPATVRFKTYQTRWEIGDIYVSGDARKTEDNPQGLGCYLVMTGRGCDDIYRILEDKYLTFGDKYYDDVLILLKTGLRISELCGLTVADIDFKNEVVVIDHQLLQNKEQGYYIETPKTKSGIRQVPLSRETIQAFQRVIKKRTKGKLIEIDGYKDFLFVNPKGNPKVAIDYNTLFVRMVKKYNKHHKDNPLPHITPHTLRHTFCTRQAGKNMNPKDLQYIMGHSNISITMNWYAHASIDTAKSEVQRLIA